MASPIMLNKIKKVSYQKALEAVIDIHLQRKKQYGDSWRNRKEYQLMGLIAEKFDRLEQAFLEKQETEIKREHCRDLINWTLFLMENLDKYGESQTRDK